MKLFFISILVFATGFCSAQNISITGIVQNQRNEPLASATLLLKFKATANLLKTTVSATDGRFKFNGLDTGSYKLLISSVGFETKEITIDNVETDKNVGVVYLTAPVKVLAEVSVVVKKPIVQILADKTVFNVENTINATGSNGWELLRKAPGLIIDNNGNIIIAGKAGVQIYVDDKPSQLRGDDLKAFLETLQSTDIAAIEIITQPSSKYDAAGNAGIINIKLKKNKNLGTNGSVTGGLTYGKYARYNSSVTFNNRTKTGNFYGTYSNSVGKNYNFLYLDRQQNGKQYDAKTENLIDFNNNNIRVGYDFFAGTKSTLGVIVNSNFAANNFTSDSRTPIKTLGAPAPDSVLVANNQSTNTTHNYNVNLNYRFADTLGHSLNIDADYGRYNSARNAYQPNLYYNFNETAVTSQKITSQQTPIYIDIFSFKTDYEQNFAGGRLSAGLKFSQVKTDNTFSFYDEVAAIFLLNNDLSNQFEYAENINAAYLNFNRKWTKWNVQAGIRVENTVSDGKLSSSQNNTDARVKRNYTNWFPSGGLTYQISAKNQFALTYSKRVERPNYASLNPFVYKIDELSFRRGNPFLQPQYTDNLKLSHTFNYRLNTSLSYSYIKDFFAQITEAEGESKNFISQRNIANQEVINLGISYPFTISKWWNVYSSLNAYTSSYQATNSNFKAITLQTLSFYGQNTFNLTKNLILEVSGWYSSPSVWGGTYRTNALGSLNIAFQKKWLTDKFNTRLVFNDVLYTNPWSGSTQFGKLFINGSGGNDSRSVGISLTYNFGKGTIKKSRNRKTGLDEESNRVDN